MHPFFELAFSLRPKETTHSDGVFNGGDTPPDTPLTSNSCPASDPWTGNTIRERRHRWGDDVTKWRCMKCMPFKKNFDTELALRTHLQEHWRIEHGGNWHQIELNNGHEKGGHNLEWARGSETSDFMPPPSPQYDVPTAAPSRAPAEDTESFAAQYMRDIGDDNARSKKVPLSAAMLQGIDPDLEETQLLIISPMRHLALHIHSTISSLAEPMDITSYSCIGGAVIRVDKVMLEAGPHVVTGTLGRVEDMIQRGYLRTKHIMVLAIVQGERMFQQSTYEQWFNVWNSLGSDVSVLRVGLEEEMDPSGKWMSE